jgi:predicted amidohydrolase YtcJ
MAARLTAYLVVAIVAATLIAGLIVGAQRDDNDGPVDLIVQNATAYTADRRGTMAEAVAIRGNQILRVGSNREIARLRRPQTVVVDAHGGAVLPGFNDANVQFIRGGLTLNSVDLTGASSAEEILDRIGSWSTANPASPWVIGRGWSPAYFRNGLPSRQMLDTVVRDRPAVMIGEDENVLWVNSKALRLARITRRTPEPVDGTIVRDARTREPAGVLQRGAIGLVLKLVPPPTKEQRVAALRSSIAYANTLGITSVQNTEDSADLLDLYEALRRSGELTVRIYSALPITEPATNGDFTRLNDTRKQYADDPLFKTGALSIRLDGAIASRSAAMLQPYDGATDAEQIGGETTFTPDDLNRTVRLADAAGWQVITYASGDRAVRMALNAYAHAVRSNRPPAHGRRHRIENLAFVDPVDVSRFGPLGIIASMQPLAASPSAERIELIAKHVGEARTAPAFPFRSLARETRLIFGSAWPGYELDPLLGIHVATTSTTPDGLPEEGWHPSQRLQLKSAIDAYTSTAAWASFDDQRKGSLSPGMLADLVVLSNDIFAANADPLPATRVAVTIFDGNIVYRRLPRSETEPAPSLQH